MSDLQHLATEAITTRATLSFNYDDRPRVIEVHAVGLSNKTGELCIRGYQVAGESSRPLPTWALFSAAKIDAPSLSLIPLSQAPRPGFSPGDKAMSTIFSEVSAS